ncbi:hypothetical protein KAH81_06925 [bacterium]|nr:hypothetical protein [bacterium]
MVCLSIVGGVFLIIVLVAVFGKTDGEIKIPPNIDLDSWPLCNFSKITKLPWFKGETEKDDFKFWSKYIDKLKSITKSDHILGPLVVTSTEKAIDGYGNPKDIFQLFDLYSSAATAAFIIEDHDRSVRFGNVAITILTELDFSEPDFNIAKGLLQILKNKNKTEECLEIMDKLNERYGQLFTNWEDGWFEERKRELTS